MNIPDGITFGSKVVVIAGYDFGFTHSGYPVDHLEGKNYHWIDRGTPIGEFEIQGSMSESFVSKVFSFNRTHSRNINCPVSGLILYSKFREQTESDLRDWNSEKHRPNAKLAILLPDDEPDAVPADQIYGGMCQLARDMRHYYFGRPRSRWIKYSFTPATLDNMINRQMCAHPRIYDALPQWSDYFDEARIKHPELRPYLKHLQ